MTDSKLLTPEAKADIQGFITSGFRPPAVWRLPVCGSARSRRRAGSGCSSCCSRSPPPNRGARSPGDTKTEAPRTLNVAFTYAGLAALGLAAAALRTFPEEFRVGMADKTRARILGDTGASAPAELGVGRPAQRTNPCRADPECAERGRAWAPGVTSSASAAGHPGTA